MQHASRLLKRLSLAFVCLLAVGQAATAQSVFINEIHYDNGGTDVGEAIEIAGPAGTDLTGWQLVLYNGNGGSVYNTIDLSGPIPDIDGGFGFVVVNLPTNGLQNGAPDGIALVNGGLVEQFLSYEGSFTATNGPATGLLSIDIGVAEGSATASGDSLQLTGSGSSYSDFSWAEAQPNTFNATNTGQSFAASSNAFINEIHYDNSGSDTGEAVEIAGTAGLDLAGWSLVLYNGSGGGQYRTIALSGVIPNQDDGFGTLFFSAPGLQNGAPDGLALVNGTDVVEFLSYEGSFTATDGPANGLTSTDIGVSEPGDTAVGDSLQLTGTGTNASAFSWAAPQANTFGAVNTGQDFGAGAPPPPPPPPPPPASLDLVINELLADPASGIDGDANGDGERDSSADEFVELVNPTAESIDISGWTLSDGVGLRHTFPAGTSVAPGCAIVVFGGSEPAGAFGGALVQTASTGFLGLNNGGDSITLSNGSASISESYGSEGGDDQSLTRDPDITGGFVRHSTANGSGEFPFSPGTRVDGTPFDGCDAPPPPEPVGPLAIHEIQGAGLTSPFINELVVTTSNVVTALAPNGFFIQTPDGLDDSNIDTSEGIFVFTGGTPDVAVGDLVTVTGEVVEFFDFTEITGDIEIRKDGAGSPLPAPVTFDASVPSPDPAAPSCAIEFECYEGMLVSIADGVVGGSNQGFGSDPIAEVYITANGERAFREPGVEFPGLPDPAIAVFDGNPEVFELDPNKLGLDNEIILAGSTFSATGVIGYEFGGYELWPTELAVQSVALPTPVRERQAAEFTVGSLNLFRLFETESDYDTRLVKFADYIVNVLDAPDVLAVQEAGSLIALQDLAADIAELDPTVSYTAYLEEGNDVGGIDVGFLVRDTVAIDAITQFAKDEILPFDGSLLHDRPPLLLEARSTDDGADYPFAVLVVHNRSLGGIDGSSGERVRAKRLAQAESIAKIVNDLQTDNPDIRLVVTGDFNAFEFSDGFVDAVGVIAGSFDPAASLLPGIDYVDPDLINQVLNIPEDERYSFVFQGSAQTLDHALTSSALDLSVRGLEFGRGNADAAEILLEESTTPLRSSDHDGLVLYIDKDLDDDGVNDDADVCPNTSIPETVGRRLLPNRYALLDDDFVFDTKQTRFSGIRREFTTEDTAGCSCSQIAEAVPFGRLAKKYGCSASLIRYWQWKVDEEKQVRVRGWLKDVASRLAH